MEPSNPLNYHERRENMKFKVNGQELLLDGSDIVSEGAVEFATFSLECDDSWNTYARTVRFRHASHGEIYDVAGVRDGQVYYIPSEVLVKGSVFVSVLGVKGASQISTTALAGFVVEGTLDGGKTPSVTPNAYAQYVESVSQSVEEIKAMHDKVLSSQYICEELTGTALGCEENCEKSVGVCADFAVLCENSSKKADAAEMSMQEAAETVKSSIQTLFDKNSELSSSENARLEAERKRVSAEEKRAEAEDSRGESEEERKTSEAERVAAERARIISDNIREERIVGLEEQVQTLAAECKKKAEIIVGRASGGKIVVDDALNRKAIALRVKGKTTCSGTPSFDNPADILGIGESGSISFTHSGKNLLKLRASVEKEKTIAGVTLTYRDATFILNGTALAAPTMYIESEGFSLPAGTYIVSGGILGCGVCVYGMEKGGYIAYSYGGQVEFTLDKTSSLRVAISVVKDTVFDSDVIRPMIRYSGTGGEFEEYFENTYTCEFSPPLYAIEGLINPIHDEADVVSGTITRRVGQFVADGTEEITVEQSAFSNYNIFSIPIAAKAYIAKSADNAGFCNYIVYSASSAYERAWAYGDKVYLQLPKSTFATVDDVRAFLTKCCDDGKPFMIFYPLEKETVEEYDWEMKNLILAEEVNNISVSEGEMELVYTKDLNFVYETLINALVELDARVSLLEV